MKARAACALAALLLAGTAARADGPPSEPLIGRWQGGGRACQGLLVITPRQLSWRTPFSRCPAQGYRSRDLGSGRTRFVLLRSTAACRFAEVELRRHDRADAQPTWEALGLPAGVPTAEALACPMVRLR